MLLFSERFLNHVFVAVIVNRQQLLDARAHPENYPNLVVRVWGWSGYFRELDPEYQDHILQRTQFTV